MRRQTSSRYWTLVLLGLLLALTACSVYGVGQSSEKPSSSSSPFGPLVISFDSMESYQRHLAYSTNPLVLFLFNHDPQAVLGFWQPLLTTFSQAMEKFGVNVADVVPESDVGQQLQQALGTSTAILFFQGIGDTPVDGTKGIKMPIAYEGAGDVVSLSKWALSCISPSTISRIHSEGDLARFFALYPQYPQLPRVLFFPVRNYTHPGYFVASQRFSYDAGFAVVPDVFATEESAAVAHRYGIVNASELPVLLVLHRAGADEDGGAGESDYVVRLNSTTHAWTYDGVSRFLDEQISDSVEKLVAKAEATQDPRVLAVAEGRRKYMAAALVDRQQDIVEEERLQMAVEPVVATTQEEFAKHCVQLPKGHQCLVAFVDSTQDLAARNSSRRVFSIVSLKLMELLGTEARKVSLVVVEREGSDEVRDYFDAGRNGYPDVVLLSLARPAKYYNFVGSFSAEAIVQFLAKHDSRLAKGEVRGGHAFIPRMVPKLVGPTAKAVEEDNEDL